MSRSPVAGEGEAPTGYWSAREAVGVLRRDDRAIIRMWGKDPARMLHGLITNDLLGAGPGRAVYAAMLTPKGRMLADLRAVPLLTDAGAEVLVELAQEALPGTAAHLSKFVPPMFARWEDASSRTVVLGVYGPRSAEVLGGVLHPAPSPLAEDQFVVTSHGEERVVVVGTREVGGMEGYDLLVGAEAAASLEAALTEAAAARGGGAMEASALEALRVEAGRPRYGAELSEATIPTEAYQTTGMMERAISFTKGCYTGQEVIVRIAHRGHVNRHLRGLRLGAAPVPEADTPLIAPDGGREVGRITSAVRSAALGETIALGYLRREVEPGSAVRLGAPDGVEAQVVDLPFPAPAR